MFLTQVFPETKTEVSLFTDSMGVNWFHANHLSEILEYTTPSRYLPTVLLDSEYREVNLGSAGRPALFVREEGVYILIMRSKSQFADNFQRWLAYEVLPSLRRAGSYSMKPEDSERFEAIGIRSKLEKAQDHLIDRLIQSAKTGLHEEVNASGQALDVVRKSLADLFRMEAASKDVDTGYRPEREVAKNKSAKNSRGVDRFLIRSLEEPLTNKEIRLAIRMATNEKYHNGVRVRDVQRSTGAPSSKHAANILQRLAHHGYGKISNGVYFPNKVAI